MANPDRARKLLVRSALVTSATIATFVGAQSLAMLDASQLEAIFTPSPEAISNPLPEVSTPLPVQQVAPELTIQQAAPSIIILRRAGQPNSGAAPSSTIQPPAQIAVPNPVLMQPPTGQIAAPNPQIVQQPIVQSSRSSR